MDEQNAKHIAFAQKLLTHFPDCSERLARLHKHTPSEGQWYTTSLKRLLGELTVAYQLLRDAHNNPRQTIVPSMSSPMEMAWRARNLLELSIWIPCFLEDKVLAQTFQDDSARDFIGWTKAANDMMIELNKAFGLSNDDNVSLTMDMMITRLKQAASQEGIDDPGRSYTNIRVAADKLGLKRWYVRQNQVLSKYAHPTAMVVMIPEAQLSEQRGVCDLFLIYGSMFFTRAFCQVSNYIDECLENVLKSS